MHSAQCAHKNTRTNNAFNIFQPHNWFGWCGLANNRTQKHETRRRIPQLSAPLILRGCGFPSNRKFCIAGQQSWKLRRIEGNQRHMNDRKWRENSIHPCRMRRLHSAHTDFYHKLDNFFTKRAFNNCSLCVCRIEFVASSDQNAIQLSELTAGKQYNVFLSMRHDHVAVCAMRPAPRRARRSGSPLRLMGSRSHSSKSCALFVFQK